MVTKFRYLIGVLIVLISLLFSSIIYINYKLNSINRFEERVTPKKEVLATTDSSSSIFLLFSTGSKGLSADDGDRLKIGKGRARMADGLTDSIMLVLLNNKNKNIGIISINRDMLVESTQRRINEAYNKGGIEEFKKQIFELTGLEIDHEIGINFAAFSDLTDALGGFSLYLENGAYDSYSKLYIENGGCTNFDGPLALSFARSRHWQIIRSDGTYSADATSSDYGRIERQQAIVRALSKKILEGNIVSKIPILLNVAKNNLTIDSDLTLTKMINFANSYKNGINNIYASTLPSNGVMLNGASVTLPDQLGIYMVINKLAKKLDFNLPQDWVGYNYIENTDVSQNQSEISNSWKPDHGDGKGGEKYPTC